MTATSSRKYTRRYPVSLGRGHPLKSISLKLPDDLDRALTLRAEHTGTTKSALIREAIEGYLAQVPGPRKGSFLGLARDLIGSVEGPGDLSSNKEYLKDYGQGKKS